MIVIQGYAIPWNKPAEVDGLIETAAPGSIAAPTAQNSNVTILYGSHAVEGARIYAQTKDRSVRFFADDYGLGFTANLDDRHADVRAAARAIAAGHVCQCSVNFTKMHRNDAGRIDWARIDHVALVQEGAYRDTGCWIASQPVNERKPWLRAMSRTFADSVISRTFRAPDMPRGTAAVEVRMPPSPRPSVPASVVALMASADWHAAHASQKAAIAALQSLRSSR